jgi:hypothetical protein
MSGKKKMNNNKELLNELKVYCPTHKHKDLDALVRKLKGDRQKIDEQIQQWWDEPVPSSASQEVWEDVNRRNKKTNDKDATASNKKSSTSSSAATTAAADGAGTGVVAGAGGRGYSGSRSGERSGGRGGFARGMGGGRGAGSDGRKSHRGRGETTTATSAAGGGAPGASKSVPAAPVPVEKKHAASSSSSAPIVSQPPVVPQTARPLQGAWGARAAAAAAPLVSVPAPVSEPVVEEPVVVVVDDVAQEPVQEDQTSEPLYTKEEKEEENPTPAGILGSSSIPTPKPTPAPAPSGGNVWATKGSAHLIQAEKKPPVVVVEKKVKKVEEPRISMPVHISPAVSFDNSGLAASVNGSNVNASGWNPTHDVVESSSLMESSSSPIKEPVAAPEPAPAIVETTTTTTTTTSLKPTSVLNMGHWETGEGEESASHDFGFGSFGQENDIASVDETTSSEPVNVSSTVSPARPPPGLGIGMPPMPEKIVHVHELENNLKNTTLAAKEEATTKKVETLPDTFNANNNNIQAAHIGHHDGFASHYGMSNYGQYPMYNYSAQMGVPGNMVPPQQQPKQQNLGAQSNAYGAPVSGNVAESASVDANAPSNPTGMPPGMMPQYNPALFYGQQNYQMGQPPGAYGYGFGAPYGGVQGYGFQQVMGQGGGYGQPYDDQAQHPSGNTHQGGYNKNTGGGYRGRNNHYQNQYNPGGYGSQPYNMGYNAYNEQRGGYLGNMDPYMNSGVYHQEGDQGKGKPKGNRNFGNQQQYQGGPQGTNQFGTGLQGAGAASANTNSGNSGLYNQGGWSGGL